MYERNEYEERVKSTIKLTRDQVKRLNEIRRVEPATARAMLDVINMVLGTGYTWLNGRVTVEVMDDEGVTRRHDVWAWAE